MSSSERAGKFIYRALPSGLGAPAAQCHGLPGDAQRRGDLRIEGMSFRYAVHSPLIHDRLSLRVNHGELVCVAGRPGSGKSTLVRLVQGFFPVDSGRILIDGLNVRNVPGNALRRYFGVLSLKPMLFGGTVRQNLRMASPDVSFAGMDAACRMAGAHALIEDLRFGYETEIGEYGANLSIPVSQHIALARALLRRPPILLLDSCPAEPDAVLAGSMIEALNRLKGEMTLMVFAREVPAGLAANAVFRLAGTVAGGVVRSVISVPQARFTASDAPGACRVHDIRSARPGHRQSRSDDFF